VYQDWDFPFLLKSLDLSFATVGEITNEASSECSEPIEYAAVIVVPGETTQLRM
jgi:hypothetical protein